MKKPNLMHALRISSATMYSSCDRSIEGMLVGQDLENLPRAGGPCMSRLLAQQFRTGRQCQLGIVIALYLTGTLASSAITRSAYVLVTIYRRVRFQTHK